MIKKVTERWLNNKAACSSSLNYIIENNYIGPTPAEFIKKLMSDDRFSDANWLIVRVMNKKQKVQYAIFTAEQVLNIYENKHPDDKRPRLAIEAAKFYLKNPCKKTKDLAYSAADLAYSAADLAYSAADLAYSAAYSAYSAAYSAYSAAYSAYSADSAYSAYSAAYSADSACSTRKKLQTKIINNGLSILKEAK